VELEDDRTLALIAVDVDRFEPGVLEPLA